MDADLAAAWRTLQAAGLPDGAARPAPASPPGPAELCAAFGVAIRAAADGTLDARDAEVLLAWLAAARHHWPARTAELLGPGSPAAQRMLEARSGSPDRRLKLRRIAIANLAAWM
jgi:hypothetical protein